MVIAAVVSANCQTSVVKPGERPEVLIETTMGNIRVQLYNETPLHRDNFLKIIREHHFYDSLLFHRVIPDFMIQAGDPWSKNAKKGEELGEHSLDYNIPAEIRLPGIYHKRGALAAAREPDNVNPKHESSSSQFYIVYGKKQSEKAIARQQHRLDSVFNDSIKMTPEMIEQYTTVGGTPHLDGGYTVFGEVLEGMDVVDKRRTRQERPPHRRRTDTQGYYNKRPARNGKEAQGKAKEKACVKNAHNIRVISEIRGEVQNTNHSN